jgi:diazepam-binding inhibitor (GABA receptor modulating acyl-CoA-binding protein)
MSLKEDFEEAATASKQLPGKPDNQTLLRLYSLYKQATEGDLSAGAHEPAPFDLVGKAKQNAWKEVQGMPKEEAMNAYIQLIQTLKVL